MTFLKTIVGISCLFLGSQSSISQLVISTPVLFADSGDVISVDFSVMGYEQMISSQGTIRFEETVLEFSHVDNFALSSISAGSFGQSGINNGLLSFSWYESNLVGKSISDTVPAFTMYFTVIGNPGSSSQFELIDDPVLAEFVDTSFVAVNHVYEQGSLTVNGGTAGIKNESPKNEWNIFPNPAKSWIQLESNLNIQNVDMLWYSMDGKLVKKNHFFYGEKVSMIITEDLKQGTYIVHIGNDTVGFETRLIEIL